MNLCPVNQVKNLLLKVGVTTGISCRVMKEEETKILSEIKQDSEAGIAVRNTRYQRINYQNKRCYCQIK